MEISDWRGLKAFKMMHDEDQTCPETILERKNKMVADDASDAEDKPINSNHFSGAVACPKSSWDHSKQNLMIN